MTQDKRNFIGLQETQLTDFSRIDVNGCWDSKDLEIKGVNSHGRSGGLVSIWNTQVFQKSEIIKSNSFLILVGNWKDTSGNTSFANIYDPQSVADKKNYSLSSM